MMKELIDWWFAANDIIHTSCIGWHRDTDYLFVSALFHHQHSFRYLQRSISKASMLFKV